MNERLKVVCMNVSRWRSRGCIRHAHAVRCEKAAALLAGLARHNAFTTADAGRYSFHSLLRSHLAKKRTPAEYRETLLRSADWLKENGCLREALCGRDLVRHGAAWRSCRRCARGQPRAGCLTQVRR